MGYKIQDLKIDIQNDLVNRIENFGMKRYNPKVKKRLAQDLVNIVDKHFKKIER